MHDVRIPRAWLAGQGWAALAAALLLSPAVPVQAQGALWLSAGGNTANTRHQAAEKKLSPANVGRLDVKWSFTTGGDVSATPAVDGAKVYVPDWAGNLYAVNRQTGALVWQASIPAATGIPGDKARASPALSGDKVVIGTQGPFGGGGKVLAFHRDTGALLWSTQVETHPAAIITQSASISGGRVFVGVASQEEALAAESVTHDQYPCCSFRGSFTALDLETGALLWKTWMVPPGYSGGAVWGSAPAVDAKRNQVVVATGNNYTMPEGAQMCVYENLAAGVDVQPCILPDNFIDAIVALDLTTGAIRWATKALVYDTWTVDCIPIFGDGDNCPLNGMAGPDYDFGQAPALYTATINGKKMDVLGAGQKSGLYWAVSADDGRVLWKTVAGPGGTAGGLQWGSAVDGRRVYTANANSGGEQWALPGGTVVTSGVWSALDASTGQLLWQVAPEAGGGTSGPVSVANGVVYGCSLDPLGHMYARDAATGALLWRFQSGGSCLSGAAISNGDVFWGSGYSNFGFGTPNKKLYAFTVK